MIDHPIATPIRICLALLAAGGSRRFGDQLPKQLARVGDQTLLSASCNTIQQAMNDARRRCQSLELELVIVLGAHYDEMIDELQDRDLSSIPRLHNDEWMSGMSTSLRCAAEHAEKDSFDGIIICAVDQPHVDAQDYAQLIETVFVTEAKHIVCAYYADTKGVPCFFPAARLGELQRLEGDKGAKSVIALYPESTIQVELPHAEFDIDTQSDLSSYLSQKQ